MDVSTEEIRENHDVDETRVADIMRDLPFAAAGLDMIVSRSVLEHLTNLERHHFRWIDATRCVGGD